MMTTRELQDEIIRLKKENDICILAHAYQSHEILEVADFTGDSYGLSKQAATAPQKNVLMCGVRFMAETCKILSPDKHVFLSNSAAGCPMAEQLDVELLQSLKAENPDYTVVAYINTTSELKTICDVCVTSSSAVKIVKNIDNNKILFIPDCNLGAWVEEQVPEKTFKFVHGGCPTHLRMSIADVERAKAAHPAANFSYIRSALQRFQRLQTISEAPPASLTMLKTAQTGNLSSELKTAYCSTYSMSALKRASIRSQKTAYATI